MTWAEGGSSHIIRRGSGIRGLNPTWSNCASIDGKTSNVEGKYCEKV